jgi:hypothetical protein
VNFVVQNFLTFEENDFKNGCPSPDSSGIPRFLAWI